MCTAAAAQGTLLASKSVLKQGTLYLARVLRYVSTSSCPHFLEGVLFALPSKIDREISGQPARGAVYRKLAAAVSPSYVSTYCCALTHAIQKLICRLDAFLSTSTAFTVPCWPSRNLRTFGCFWLWGPICRGGTSLLDWVLGVVSTKWYRIKLVKLSVPASLTSNFARRLCCL